jgi:hypothetical protein
MTTATLERAGYARPTIVWNGLTVTDLFCGAGGSSSDASWGEQIGHGAP